MALAATQREAQHIFPGMGTEVQGVQIAKIPTVKGWQRKKLIRCKVSDLGKDQMKELQCSVRRASVLRTGTERERPYPQWTEAKAG